MVKTIAILLLAASAQDGGDLFQKFGGGKKTENGTVTVVAVRPEKPEVRAGETFNVAFDLSITEAWHIYPVAKTTTGLPTTFEFEGAAVAGRIVEPKPKLHPKEEFLDAYTYHEGAITMTVPVRLDAGTKPGPRTVRGKIRYQICKEICVQGETPVSFDVTVAEGKAAAPDPSDFFKKLQSGGKDTGTVTVVGVVPGKPEVKVGETFPVVLDLSITEGWHIYPVAKTTTGLPTTFEFEGAAVAGNIVEPEPKIHPKEEFLDAYGYHEGAITMTVPVRLDEGAQPGPLAVKGKIVYQICKSICVNGETAFSFDLTVLEGKAEAAVPPADSPLQAAGPSFGFMLALAFAGGLLLNVMPCVLPVLTLKLFSLVKQKNITAGARRVAAVMYTAGVLGCLNAFALAVVILRSFGNQVGWGFQFQEPGFVIVLTTIVFIFALSLLGVFELPTPGGGVAGGPRRDWIGHLISGFFVTLIATPCSAPFLGTGLGFAFTLPSWGIFLFFTAAALGLASPFLLIGFVPGLLRFLPKPGPWVETFKKVMGFTLVATSVWLMDTIATLTGQAGLIGFLGFLTVASIAAWIYGKWGNEVASTRSKLASVGIAAALILIGARGFLVTQVAELPVGPTGFVTEGLDFSGKIPWQPFSEENVKAVRDLRKPGFIDFTADW